MITTNTPSTKIAISNDDETDLNSKFRLYESSPSSVRHLHHQQQYQKHLPSQRLNPQWNASVGNNKNMNNTKQHKKQSSQSPAPFLSFQVEDEQCAVYVGNIPLDERTPCKICCKEVCNNDNDNENDNGNDNDNDNESVTGETENLTNDENCCACAVELKAFLRDRINAAFKVPIDEIGIRTCRLFSVVTNVYSNSNADGGSEISSTNTNPNNFRQRSGRRVHRAACVEFDDPKIAEHTLALKFTSFHFDGQPQNRSSLRMRRWTSQPPPPPPPSSNSSSPREGGSKQRYTPPPPRSKSISPKISNLKRQQLPPPPPPRPKSVSPNILGRKQHQRRNQLSFPSTATISERPSSPLLSTIITNLGCTIEDDGGLPSPSFSSCIIHVGNIPAEATSSDLRRFFLERMNKAFHGVTPPEIIRLGMRNNGSANQSRIDAYVEFQEPKVAFRATQLKNRRWYCKDENIDGAQLDEEGVDDKDDDADDANIINYDDDKRKRNMMPLLEIEMWDHAKQDTNDFFFMNENNKKSAMGFNSASVLGSAFHQAKAIEGYENACDMWEDEIGATKKMPAKTSPRTSPKTLPSQPNKSNSTIEEARERGLLVCTNTNKTPKCDHLFTIFPQQGEEISCLGEVKKARMCHGYVFRGKACRQHRKRGGNNKKSDGLCGPVCPFAHIESFDQLKDPHDILSLLYYVENNDDIEFSSGIGLTPQEYLLRQHEWPPKVKEGKSLTKSNHLNQQSDSPTQSTDEMLRELRSNVSAVRQESAITQVQLLKSELARQSLLAQLPLTAVRDATEDTISNMPLPDEKDTTIHSLQDEVAQLRNDLQESNHKLKASELAVENSKREYAFLQEKHQHHLSREGKSQISTELLELEVIKLREELKKQQQLNGTPTIDTPVEDSWRDINLLDTFLERSLPTLMQMTDGNTDDQIQLNLPPKPRLTDIPVDCESSRHVPYRSVVDCNPMQSLGLSAPAAPINTTDNPIATDEDSSLSEIAYLVSCYGNQVFVNTNHTDASTTVTRFLKLPMNLYQGRDIDVALVLTLPKDYPWNGSVKVHSDSRLSYHFGADSQYKKLASESVSGLLNVCRWEAEASVGQPHVLMNIMKSAERWVKNDWKIIQKKNLVIEYDSQDDFQSSSHLPS